MLSNVWLLYDMNYKLERARKITSTPRIKKKPGPGEAMSNNELGHYWFVQFFCSTWTFEYNQCRLAIFKNNKKSMKIQTFTRVKKHHEMSAKAFWNHQQLDCLSNSLLMVTNKTSKLPITGPFVTRPLVTFALPPQLASNAESIRAFPCHYVMFFQLQADWQWRHNGR